MTMSEDSKSIYWHGLDPIAEITLPDRWPWEDYQEPRVALMVIEPADS